MEDSVLVIGAGPVGLTMAAELARYGVPVRIVDKAAQRTDKSKALVLWSRSLELIDRMGCVSSFLNAGLKVTLVNMTAGSRRIAQINLDAIRSPYPFALMLPQSETERLMEQHLNDCGVQVERQTELLSFTADKEDVTATLRHADGRDEVLQANWLIGCDGAHSTVRHTLGMKFEGDTLPSEWILADVHLDGPRLVPDELEMFWHAAGVLALFPISAGRYRVIADVGNSKGEKHADPALPEVQAILDQRGPGGIRASSPIWMSSFRINERKVADYRAGRAFLAGDAAHVHSPAGGQGMNTGIQDACNLAWKLALVCKGLAAEEPLLGSYSTERSAVGRQVLQDAGRLTMIAMLKGGFMQGLRNHAGSLLLHVPAVRAMMANKFAELSIAYPKSPLTQSGGAVPAALAAGKRAPVREGETPVGGGTAPRFALYGLDSEAAAVLIDRFKDLLEPGLRPPFDERHIWLVRPDGYIAMVADTDGWNEVGSYLQRIVG